MAFHAHEVLEAAWKDGPVRERELWQALAQLAVGITHIQRGNRAGAVNVLRRAGAGLAGATAAHGIDIAGLTAYAQALIEDLEAAVDIPPGDLRPRLTIGPTT